MANGLAETGRVEDYLLVCTGRRHDRTGSRISCGGDVRLRQETDQYADHHRRSDRASGTGDHDDDRILTILTSGPRCHAPPMASRSEKAPGHGFCPEPSCFAALVLCCSSIRDRYQVDSAETDAEFLRPAQRCGKAVAGSCTWHSSVPRWRRQRRRPGNSCALTSQQPLPAGEGQAPPAAGEGRV